MRKAVVVFDLKMKLEEVRKHLQSAVKEGPFKSFKKTATYKKFTKTKKFKEEMFFLGPQIISTARNTFHAYHKKHWNCLECMDRVSLLLIEYDATKLAKGVWELSNDFTKQGAKKEISVDKIKKIIRDLVDLWIDPKTTSFLKEKVVPKKEEKQTKKKKNVGNATKKKKEKVKNKVLLEVGCEGLPQRKRSNTMIKKKKEKAKNEVLLENDGEGLPQKRKSSNIMIEKKKNMKNKKKDMDIDVKSKV